MGSQEGIEERWDEYLGAVVEVVTRAKTAVTVEKSVGAWEIPIPP